MSAQHSSSPVKLVITSGEPAGIGPDLVLSLLAFQQQHSGYQLLVLADPELLRQRAQHLGLDIPLDCLEVKNLDEIRHLKLANDRLNILPVQCDGAVKPGSLNVRHAPYVMDMLDTAIALCQQNICHAMVTCPIQKSILIEAGYAIQGHTEYLAERCNTPRVVMMLANSELRVALVTTHLPLRDVADAIDAQSLMETLEILDQDLQMHFGIEEPQIYVCGLNPHAGENGHLGMEEITIIEPVLNELREQGLHIHGPLAADTIFSTENRQHADAFVAMYHDQGLAVLKALGFGDSINITLGLPIIRTSVDHGTALSLAASGKASNQSLLRAVAWAQHLANNKFHA